MYTMWSNDDKNAYISLKTYYLSKGDETLFHVGVVGSAHMYIFPLVRILLHSVLQTVLIGASELHQME